MAATIGPPLNQCIVSKTGTVTLNLKVKSLQYRITIIVGTSCPPTADTTSLKLTPSAPSVNMQNNIEISFVQKTRRLALKVPFYLNEAVREIPSRKFDPKTKLWMVNLTPANVRFLQSSQLNLKYTEEAREAIMNMEQIIQTPVIVQFPYDKYDFMKAAKPFAPMNHQYRMLDYGWSLKTCAWIAKMGTGKTYAGIHLMCARWAHHQIDQVVVICPSGLKTTWAKEFAKYGTVPYRYLEHDTKAPWIKTYMKETNESIRARGELPIITVSVEGLGVSENLYDSVCGLLVGRRTLMVIDESSRIKNHKAQRTQRTWNFTDITDYRLILNGTPIALGIQDLFAQYEFLDPNIIGCGDYWAYKTRYIETGGFEGKQIISYKHMDELMNLIMPYTVEVSKDVLKLPPKVPKQRYIKASPEQKRLFKLIIKGNKTGDPNLPLIKTTNSLERNLRLQQVIGGWLPRWIPNPTGDDVNDGKTILEPLKDNPKMDDLFQMIEDNFVGSKFIIWTTFVHEIEFIAEHLEKKYGQKAVRKYYGATAKADRSQIEDDYCNDPTMRFFVANPATAGLGLTLISGENDIMWYYSGTNRYIDRAQSEDRAHRIGQDNTVVVGDSIMENTLDEAIFASKEAKIDLEAYIFEKLKRGEDIELMG